MRSPADELLEVVDHLGTVLSLATRAEMRARNLRHRSVYVVVRAPGAAEILVHRRASWKDVWPDRWDLAFGGVAGVGESWTTAAVRELVEEAGVTVDEAALDPLSGGVYDDEHVSVLGRAYAVEHPGPFRFADGEVTEVAWVPVASLDAWLGRHETCPDTVALVAAHLLS